MKDQVIIVRVRACGQRLEDCRALLVPSLGSRFSGSLCANKQISPSQHTHMRTCFVFVGGVFCFYALVLVPSGYTQGLVSAITFKVTLF